MATPEQVNVWVGLDVGKEDHFAEVLGDDGERLFAQGVPNDQAVLEELLTRAAEHGVPVLCRGAGTSASNPPALRAVIHRSTVLREMLTAAPNGPACSRPAIARTICPRCRQEIERRARRLAHLVALATTAALALYVMLRLPADRQGRLMSALAVVLWYILVKLVVQRSARELLP